MEDTKYKIGNMFINDDGYVITINNILKDAYGEISYRLNGNRSDCFCHDDYLDRLKQIVIIER